MIEAATKRNADQVAEGRASFVCAPFADADFGDARFDRVLAIHVGTFERDQPALELDKIAEHLAEGGRLHLSYQPLAAGAALGTAARLSATLQSHRFAVESVLSRTSPGAGRCASSPPRSRHRGVGIGVLECCPRSEDREGAGTVKLVIGIVRPEKANDVLEALYRAEVRGVSMSRVQGHGGELDGSRPTAGRP